MNKRIKKTYVCRDIAIPAEHNIVNKLYNPVAGDVAVFEVLSIGKHKQVQGMAGKNTLIFPGDLLMAAFGTRYATAQFEGYIPDQPCDEYHILGAGGTVGLVHSSHARFEQLGPTKLRLVGYVTNTQGRIINTRSVYQQKLIPFSGNRKAGTKIILSIGATMDSGKTTTAAWLVRGLSLAGKKASFIKLTGTIYTKDRDLVYDMGADTAVDFGDLGYPSTYCVEEKELLDLYESLVGQCMINEPDYIVMEIADGILQRETAMLLRNKTFMETIDEVIFSCGDSLSAIRGLETLAALDIYPFAISGCITASPLLMQEVQALISCPLLTLKQLEEAVPLQLMNEQIYSYAS